MKCDALCNYIKISEYYVVVGKSLYIRRWLQSIVDATGIV